MAKKKEATEVMEEKKEIVKTEPMKETPKKDKKPNAWLIHVKAFRAKNPEMTYKEVLQKARETYKKGGSKPSEKPLEIKKEPAEPAEPKKKMKKVKKVKVIG